MYINPFFAGIVATIIVELVLLVVASLISSIKKNK